MAVIKKDIIQNIKRDLNRACEELTKSLSGRGLQNSKEGAGADKCWEDPDKYCYVDKKQSVNIIDELNNGIFNRIKNLD